MTYCSFLLGSINAKVSWIFNSLICLSQVMLSQPISYFRLLVLPMPSSVHQRWCHETMPPLLSPMQIQTDNSNHKLTITTVFRPKYLCSAIVHHLSSSFAISDLQLRIPNSLQHSTLNLETCIIEILRPKPIVESRDLIYQNYLY